MDSAFYKKNKCRYREVVFSLIKKKREKSESILFYNGTRSQNFITNDSGLYFDSSKKFNKKVAKKEQEIFFDSLNYQADEIVNRYRKIRGSSSDVLYVKYNLLKRRLERNKKELNAKSRSLIESISMVRLWNTSIVVAILIGMISTTAIYRYLGQGAVAGDIKTPAIVSEQIKENENKWNGKKESEYMREIASYLEIKEEDKFNKNAQEMVEDYPIENMMTYILGKDNEVASFLIAIAKKESNWGKRVPVLNGKDCYNYWGYRGQRKNMGSGGHTCFDSRKDAVDTVGKRIKELMEKYNRDTPQEMVVWKCGSSCATTGGQASANKWISDVDMYMKKLNTLK